MNSFAHVPFMAKTLGLLVGLAAAVLPTGCGSAPEPLPPKVATGLGNLRNEAVSLKGQIEKTSATLQDLMAKPQADLTPQNASFTQELTRLEGRVERAQAQRRQADQMVAAQFASWDAQLQQLQSEESQEMAAERRKATAETYDEIQKRIAAIRTEITPLLTDLRDIRQYLKGDLSPKGLETMKPTADRVYSQKDRVVAELDAIIASITDALGK